MSQVAALFVRSDSIYKTLPGVDCFDIDRDARTFQGGMPVVAHPPCRAWGKLFYFAKPRPDEKNLGRLAVALVRECGGVLEHPKDSKLWPAQMLPKPSQAPDMWGGWTLPVSQFWFGHRAEKLTWLYIVGCHQGDVPPLPLRLGRATHVIASSRNRRIDGTRLRSKEGNPVFTGWRPEVTKAEREHTPPELAMWLVELARRCRVAERKAA